MTPRFSHVAPAWVPLPTLPIRELVGGLAPSADGSHTNSVVYYELPRLVYCDICMVRYVGAFPTDSKMYKKQNLRKYGHTYE